MITPRRGPGLIRETVDRTARRRAAARRARVLLSLAVAALTSWGIVALPGVPWWTAVPATALLVLDVAALVVSARRRAAARRRTAARVARTAVLAQRRVASARRPAVAGGAPVPGPRTDSTDLAAIDVAAAERAARGRRPEVAAASEHGREHEDGTWTPVPVPRPTYLLKPVVRRQDPAPLVSDPDVVIAASASNQPDRAGQREAPASATASAAATSTTATSATTTGSGSSPRPWEVEHTWADDLDLFLARRRAVNG